MHKGKLTNINPQELQLSPQETCFIFFLRKSLPFLKSIPIYIYIQRFLPEIEVQDFPVRGKTVYLRIKRRRWEDPETGQTYSRDWNLVASGTRITAEFGAFLKSVT